MWGRALVRTRLDMVRVPSKGHVLAWITFQDLWAEDLVGFLLVR